MATAHEGIPNFSRCGDAMVKDLTKGKPFGLILGLSLSFIIGNVFQYFYSTVDALVVGRVLGADALAAVGATGSLTFLILGFSQGIAGGFGVVVGQYFGAKNDEELKCAVTHVVYRLLLPTAQFVLSDVNVS